MADFHIKQNDTSPALEYTLLPATDLTGASVRFHMKDAADVVKVDAVAVISDAANGVVQYEWQAADTDTVGSFEAEFEVTYADSTIETFPNTGNLKIVIPDDIA